MADQRETLLVPVSVQYFDESGFFGGAEVVFFDQKSTGQVDAALLPLSFATGYADSRGATVKEIPLDWHQPLRQRVVRLSRASAAADSFYAYLIGPQARSELDKAGLQLPEAGQ